LSATDSPLYQRCTGRQRVRETPAREQLGHANISITLNLYARWFAAVDTRAADDLGAALLGNQTGNQTGS
jgi:hypothetical protein